MATVETRRHGAHLSALVLLAAVVSGCGDRCDSLCLRVRDRVDDCRGDALTWHDLGARGPADYLRRCRREWDDKSASLTSRELELALDVCADAADVLPALTCDDVVELYAPE